MSQLHFYVPDDIEAQIRIKAKRANLTLSKYLAELVKRESLAKTGEISAYHNKGMHTTTFSEMFHLTSGGRIIDTPGIKGFGTVDMEAVEISHYFKEIFAESRNCRFSNCKHTNEPGCSVLSAVDNQHISTSRYQSYISMLGDCDSGKYR